MKLETKGVSGECILMLDTLLNCLIFNDRAKTELAMLAFSCSRVLVDFKTFKFMPQSSFP